MLVQMCWLPWTDGSVHQMPFVQFPVSLLWDKSHGTHSGMGFKATFMKVCKKCYDA